MVFFSVCRTIFRVKLSILEVWIKHITTYFIRKWKQHIFMKQDDESDIKMMTKIRRSDDISSFSGFIEYAWTHGLGWVNPWFELQTMLPNPYIHGSKIKTILYFHPPIGSWVGHGLPMGCKNRGRRHLWFKDAVLTATRKADRDSQEKQVMRQQRK